MPFFITFVAKSGTASWLCISRHGTISSYVTLFITVVAGSACLLFLGLVWALSTLMTFLSTFETSAITRHFWELRAIFTHVSLFFASEACIRPSIVLRAISTHMAFLVAFSTGHCWSFRLLRTLSALMPFLSTFKTRVVARHFWIFCAVSCHVVFVLASETSFASRWFVRLLAVSTHVAFLITLVAGHRFAFSGSRRVWNRDLIWRRRSPFSCALTPSTG